MQNARQPELAHARLTNLASAETIGELHTSRRGPVAQLGARFHGMEEVIGSIPIRSTNQPLQNQWFAEERFPQPYSDLVSIGVNFFQNHFVSCTPTSVLRLRLGREAGCFAPLHNGLLPQFAADGVDGGNDALPDDLCVYV